MDNNRMACTLIELRGKRSRKAVARAIGISISSIRMYEQGERVPRDEIKKKIANYYKKSVKYIFFDQNVTKSEQNIYISYAEML